MQPNAFATGRNPKPAVVAVTWSIVRLRDRRELRGGVLAHGLGHVKSRPEALARALEKLEQGAHAVPAPMQPAAASLLLVNPFSGSESVLNLFSTNPRCGSGSGAFARCGGTPAGGR